MSDTKELQELTAEQKSGINTGMVKFFSKPFEAKYEEKFVDAEFWAAVENFQAYAKELGFKDDPIEYMKRKGSFEDYEALKKYLKDGPPAFVREGWVSELVGQTVEVKKLVDRCQYLAGPKFSSKERVVVLDFWATWCTPCMESALLISDLADKHAGKVAFIAINNDAIFGPDQPHDVEKIKTVVKTKKDTMRYTVVLDSVDHYAKKEVFTKAGFMAVPCMMVIVDNKMSFVGDYETKAFQTAIVAGIEATSGPQEE
ncbi:hypothetical protein EMPS_04125 [Entomortierella parvispora]|uniref:Thioredoxin domain-containing protein n=1 Tax=Entomortierella parvispora TaxID=205924 RepID=A0A9P3LV66_9FUNG|nr:hypothetical protein EMPS_04125 [Entomortierella parvispora]